MRRAPGVLDFHFSRDFLKSGMRKATRLSVICYAPLLPLLLAVSERSGQSPAPGTSRIDSKGIEQVWVPAGSFIMGSDEATVERLEALNPPRFVLGEFRLEQPAHRVAVTKGFWIDKFEVTRKAFDSFVADAGYQDRNYWSAAGWDWLSRQPTGQLPRYCVSAPPDHPIVCVSWYEAEAYARWRGGRLPTEAQWEYAARGPNSRIYPWGNEFDASRCNIVESKGTQAVGSYPTGTSWVGAHDMAGNAMEWVQDWLADYSGEPAEDPGGPTTGKVKVEKGGWWGGPLFVGRCAYRHFEDPPEYSDHHIGFRVASKLR